MLKLHAPNTRDKVSFLVGELRPGMPHGAAKKRRKKRGSRRSKQTFLQRQTDGQKAHEKMLNTTNY